MANLIKKAGIPAMKYVTPTSRYAKSTTYLWGEEKAVIFGTYKRQKMLEFDEADQWTEITKSYEYRPDLVSNFFYGTSDFWWKIMEYNGMNDILQFKAGINIRIPGNVYI